MVTYEEQRLQNIRDNQALLLSLGLSAPTPLAPKRTVKAVSKSSTPSKNLAKSAIDSSRKRRLAQASPQFDTPIKRSRADDDDSPRRSARNSGKKTDYSDAGLERAALSARVREGGSPVKREGGGEDDEEEYEGSVRERGERGERMRNAKRMGIRTQDPKTFGHIPGVPVGRWYASRMDASTDAIHARVQSSPRPQSFPPIKESDGVHSPTVAGISGNATEGAYSVALSGGYADDVDMGYAFTYTGCGGRDLKGTKQNPKNLRTAAQTFHQSFDWPYNAALKKSAETRKPVRVLRGYKLDSAFAPLTGYRYDGLYVVEKAWMGKGLTNGLLVCRYAFKRMEGQPELPLRGQGNGGDEVAAEEVDDAAEGEWPDEEEGKVELGEEIE